MYTIQGNSYHFVLIDFDMAVVVEDNAGQSTYKTSSKHRTGTLPFMAHELVLDAWKGAQNPSDWKPIRHHLRHDYESLLFVSFWLMTSLTPRGTKSDVEHDMLVEFAKSLQRGGLLQLSDRKRTTCTTSLGKAGIILPKPTSILTSWFNHWTLVFLQAETALEIYDRELADFEQGVADAPPPFDHETVNGMITRDRLKAALDPYIPALSKQTAGRAHEFKPRLDGDTDNEEADEVAPNDHGPELSTNHRSVAGPSDGGTSHAHTGPDAARAKVDARIGEHSRLRSRDKLKKPKW